MNKNDWVNEKGSITDLHKAAKAGHIERAQELIDLGHQVDGGWVDGYNTVAPIIECIRGGNEEMALFFVEKGSHIHEPFFVRGTTRYVLEEAAMMGMDCLVLKLIKAGVKIDQGNPLWEVARHMKAMSKTPRDAQLNRENLKKYDRICWMLICNYKRTKNPTDYLGQALNYLLFHKKWRQRLLKMGADINYGDNSDPKYHTVCCTPALMQQIRDHNKNYHFYKWLIKHGANPNAVNEMGDTALMDLQFFSNIDPKGTNKIARLLMRHGADVNAKDCMGNTALAVAAAFGDRSQEALILKNGGGVDVSSEIFQLAVEMQSHRLTVEQGGKPRKIGAYGEWQNRGVYPVYQRLLEQHPEHE